MKTLDELLRELPPETQDRVQRRVQELIENEKKPDEFAYHEAMDRAYLLEEMVGNYLCDHSAIQLHPEWKRLAHAARDALSELYNQTATAVFKS